MTAFQVIETIETILKIIELFGILVIMYVCKKYNDRGGIMCKHKTQTKELLDMAIHSVCIHTDLDARAAKKLAKLVIKIFKYLSPEERSEIITVLSCLKEDVPYDQ